MERVYDMSFAEFQIRLFAWKRLQDREWEKVRTLAWHIESASFHRRKKMPSMHKFMPLDIDNGIENNTGISEAQKQRFLEATKEYYKQLNKK